MRLKLNYPRLFKGLLGGGGGILGLLGGLSNYMELSLVISIETCSKGDLISWSIWLALRMVFRE